jgi:hypothetical protein
MSSSTEFNPANFPSSHLVDLNSVAFPYTPAQFANTPAPFANIPVPFLTTPAPFPNIYAPFLNTPAPFPNIPAPFLNTPAPFPNIPAPFTVPPHPINVNSVAFPNIPPAVSPDTPVIFQETPDSVANGQFDYSEFDFGGLDFSNIFDVVDDGAGVASTEGMEIGDAEGDQDKEVGQEAQNLAHLYDPKSLEVASAS